MRTNIVKSIVRSSPNHDMMERKSRTITLLAKGSVIMNFEVPT